ncbi:c-type cytochrome [uncultured Alsobacter sp.]|uniref:c-type cytochrome n=1 Tax=uncultured Alsobacter sp. TaxID=1748258 RepID=UPI0025D793FB|nr:c-type cytochrome [uncultured Alsobacter sp.]
MIPPRHVRAIAVALATLIAVPLSAARAAGTAPAGATACSGCHGGPAASVGPAIAGRPAADIAGAMQAFRTGERAGTVMPRIAKGFTAEESAAIAAWWSEAKP